jgi:hypothetical protein
MLLGLAGLLTAGLVALLGLAWSWLPTQEEMAARIGDGFHARTGVQVDLSHVHWSLWPQPTLVIENAVTRQASPILARRIRLQASWASVLRRQPKLQEVHLDGLVVPQVSLREFRDSGPDQDGADPAARWPPGGLQLRFRDLTWINRRGIELDYEGSFAMDEDGLPRRAQVARAGSHPSTQLRLEREGAEDRWRVLIDVPGGSLNGQAQLARGPAGRLRITAQLEPKNIDVEALLAVFKRHSVVAGRANGNATLSAEGDTPVGLLRSLRTNTHFLLRPARLTRFDLMKVVQSAGASDRGQTMLDELSGVLDTQNTASNGTQYRYSALAARSGLLSASGNVRLLRNRLDGELAVDLVDGVVGIPLTVSGTVEEPKLGMTGGALAGAAVGTAVLPGVGTAIGARVGRQVERLLDEPAKRAPGESPAAPAKPRR